MCESQHAPQSTAVQIGRRYQISFTTLPMMQCKMAAEVKMRGKPFECFPSPKVFFLLLLFNPPTTNPSEFKNSHIPKGKTKTVLCADDGELYCDMSSPSWRWEPRSCTSLCLCRKGKQIHHRVNRQVQDGRSGIVRRSERASE